MIFGFNGNARMKTLAGALVLGLVGVVSAAHAATQVGGGATLPAIAYAGTAADRQLSPLAGSLLGEYTAAGNPAVSYCQTGSGTGKAVLAGVGGNVQLACQVGVNGFGAPAVGRSDLAQPNFAGADSPLSVTDFNNYVSGHPTSFPVEFPAIAGAIAVAYNKAGVDTLDLSEDQVCRIFSGRITDWSQISSASGPIKVVYRSDGSGTTFGFSNHLSAVCAGSASQHFVTDQAFTTVVSKYFTTGGTLVLPSNWSGQSGNPAVAQAVVDNDGSIAYVEAANAGSLLSTYATIGGKDPFADFGNAALPIASTSLLYRQAINGADPNTGRPLTTVISGAPNNQCIALVDPSAYAAPTSGYPIVAVSYLLANSNNNGADTTAVKNLLWAPYNAAVKANVNTVGPTTGFAFLSTSLTQAQVQGCVAKN